MRRPLASILAAAIGLAIALVYWGHFAWLPDPHFGFSRDFTLIFEGLSASGHFTRQLSDGRVIPETLREPFYPLALLASDDVLGAYTRIVYLQELALVATCLTWIAAAWRWLGAPWAVALAVLVYFNQPIFFYGAELYPYAFNVFFLSTALLSLVLLLRRRRLKWAVLAGLCFGLAVLERGSLALLPFFLAGCFLLLPALVSRRAVLALILSYAACVTPWLARNASYGIYGMHGMMGQILGYTYGDIVLARGQLPGAGQRVDPFGLRPEYLEHLRRETADSGTWAFLHDLELRGYSTAQINRILIFYVKQAVREDPSAAVRVMLRNLGWFPCRLLQRRVPSRDPWTYYAENVMVMTPTLMDWIVVALAAAGAATMALRRESALAVILPVLVYLVAVNVPLVVFDPRYRNGVFDIFAYLLGLYALREMARLLRLGLARPN